jgi:cytidine deaminase
MTIHGEQFAVSLAYSLGGVKGFDIFAQQAPSCGHCVQFLNEIKDSKEIEYLIPHYKNAKLGSMMKYSFGPEALGLKTALFSSDDFKFENPKPKEATAAKAFEMAQKSYAPYSKCPGGGAIETSDGEIYWGAYLENAAFNPIVSPFHAALIHMTASGKKYSDIKNVWVAEKENCSVSHSRPATMLLATLNPKIKIELIKLK